MLRHTHRKMIARATFFAQTRDVITHAELFMRLMGKPILVCIFLLAAFGCAGSSSKKSSRPTIADSELTASYGIARPKWANVDYINIESQNYSARVGFGVTGGRQAQVVVDSLRRNLTVEIVGDIETRVSVTLIDSMVSQTTYQGTKRVDIGDHLTQIISKHYSPEIAFNGQYDSWNVWKDTESDTIWALLQFKTVIYRENQQRDLEAALEKQGLDAYTALEKSYRAFSLEGNVQKSLRFLGESSLHIHRGGGVYLANSLFSPGESDLVLTQHEEMLENYARTLEFRLVDDVAQFVLTPQSRLVVEIEVIELSAVNMNIANVRVNSEGKLLSHPQVFRMGTDNRIRIPFNFPADIGEWNPTDIPVTVSFDLLSEKTRSLAPGWENEDDYLELLKKLPHVEFTIRVQEFQPKSTWCIVDADFPVGIEAIEKNILKTMERRLGNYHEFFTVTPSQEWDVAYDRVQAHKSKLDALGAEDKEDFNKHDLNAFLSVVSNSPGVYSVALTVDSPQPGGELYTKIEEEFTLRELQGEAIRQLVDAFMNEHFFRTVIVQGSNADTELEVDDPVSKLEPIDANNISIKYLSRFRSYILRAKQPGYREQDFLIPRQQFTLYPGEQTVQQFSLMEMVPESGTLNVTGKCNVTDATVTRVA